MGAKSSKFLFWTRNRKRRPSTDIREGRLEARYRAILVGDKCTGKTAIIRRLENEKFLEVYKPTNQYGVDEIPGHKPHHFRYYVSKSLDDGLFHLTLRDTCERDSLPLVWRTEMGHSYGRFSSERNSESEKRLCCVIVYSVTDRESFEGGAKKLVREARELGVENILLLGNKCDCVGERQVGYFEAKEFSIENDMSFFEVSAKDGSNIEVAFMSFFSNKLHWEIREELSMSFV